MSFVHRSYAGDIPGIPIVQPPGLHDDLQIQLSNDFFSVLNNADDYRTQQITLSAKLSDKWLLVLDQSMLTLRGPQHELPDPPGTEGRLDQLSASLSYQFYFHQENNNIEQLLIGAGLRSYGDFNGARIQNGVHRMLENDLIDLPYIGTQRTDATFWLRASRQRYFYSQSDKHNWEPGYWLDGSALQTTDGQFDATLGAYGLVKYYKLDMWFGLRGDWRQGYDRDFVQRAVAEQEQGAALALGIAYGPIRLETIEGIGDNKNSFGRLVLSAENDPALSPDLTGQTIAYQFSVLSPEVAIQNQLRWSPQQQNKIYRYALVFDHRYATAAKNNTATLFNISQQFVVGLEAAFGGQSKQDWILPYLMIGAGYRSEYLEGQGTQIGQQSDKVNSAVLVSDAGFRMQMSGQANEWQLQLQLGLTGWIPLQNKNVNFNNENVEILHADAAWVTGISMVWRI